MNAERIFLSPPFAGDAERRAVMAAFDSKYLAPTGPMVDEFERRLAALSGRRHAVALSSATAAIDLLMAEFGVDCSWTIVAPTLTFIATVGPAFHRGARTVFIDCDETGNMDVTLLGEALAELKRELAGAFKVVVVGVDLYGRCCDYEAIEELCRRFGALFVVDAAEALGATRNGRPAGSAGVAGVYSFNGNKIITTSGGGAIVTDDGALAARARKRSQQSREPRPWYEHREVGYNYRLSNLLAAMGIAQLDRLDWILARRREHADRYRQRLRLLPKVEGENHWLSIALCASRRERDELLERFARANIEARAVWKPLHLQPVFNGARTYGGKVAERLFRRGLCLPSGTGLSENDFQRIFKVV